MRRCWRTTVAAVATAALAAACSFSENGVPLPGANDASSAADADINAPDASITIDAPPGTPDANTTPDAFVPVPDAGPIDILHVLAADEFFGSSPLTLGDGDLIDTMDLTINGAPPPAGVTFQRTNQETPGQPITTLHVTTLTVMSGATVEVRGDRPLVVVASGEILIEGVLDGSANRGRPGPGGFTGGNGPQGGSDGENQSTFLDSGGGGAGFGTAGAKGGDSPCGMMCTSAIGGDAGGVYGDPPQTWLHGGSGGGRGASQCSGDRVGGGGGGAIQLYSASSITVSVTGGIAVNGGGGAGGEPCPMTATAGSGGGSGGSIFLQAPIVTTLGLLTANGGGGGGGANGSGDGSPGQDGQFSTSAAAGGPGAGMGGASGGAGGVLGSAPTPGNDAFQGNAGGGGGAVGRVSVHTRLNFTNGGVITPTAVERTY